MQVAELKNNIVQRVVVADSVNWCIDNLGGEWVRTYYDDPNKNFASIDSIYYPEYDNFSEPQPYASWTLDSKLQWQPPIPYPSDGCLWTWDEKTLSWIDPICI